MESACYSVCDTLAEPNFWKSNFESFKSNQASRKRCRHVFNISCSLFIYKFTDWKSLITYSNIQIYLQNKKWLYNMVFILLILINKISFL